MIIAGFGIRRAAEVTARFAAFCTAAPDAWAALAALCNRPLAAKRLTYAVLEELRAAARPGRGYCPARILAGADIGRRGRLPGLREPFPAEWACQDSGP